MRVLDYIEQHTSEFQNLIKMINESGLVGVMDTNTFTLFAPTDDAFKKLSDRKLRIVQEMPAKQLLDYHTVQGGVFTPILRGNRVKLMTNLSTSPYLTVEGRGLTQIRVGNILDNQMVHIIQEDIQCDNGCVVHVIDGVLTPDLNPSCSSIPNY